MVRDTEDETSLPSVLSAVLSALGHGGPTGLALTSEGEDAVSGLQDRRGGDQRRSAVSWPLHCTQQAEVITHMGGSDFMTSCGLFFCSAVKTMEKLIKRRAERSFNISVSCFDGWANLSLLLKNQSSKNNTKLEEPPTFTEPYPTMPLLKDVNKIPGFMMWS